MQTLASVANMQRAFFANPKQRKAGDNMQQILGQYAWMDAYCLAKAGVTKDYQLDWEATRYFIGGKMFVMIGGDRDGKPIITMKLEPAFGELLRSQFQDIVPGYHMNKIHWNSLYIGGQVPDSVLRDMLDNAYQMVFATLSAKTRQAISASDPG